MVFFAMVISKCFDGVVLQKIKLETHVLQNPRLKGGSNGNLARSTISSLPKKSSLSISQIPYKYVFETSCTSQIRAEQLSVQREHTPSSHLIRSGPPTAHK